MKKVVSISSPVLLRCLMLVLLGMTSYAAMSQSNPLDLQYASRNHPVSPEVPSSTQLDTSQLIDPAGAPAAVSDLSTSSEVTDKAIRSAQESQVPDPPPSKERSKLLLSFILITSALITTIIISSQKQTVSRVFKAVLNPNFMGLLHREQRRYQPQVYLSHFVLFVINGGIFLSLHVMKFMDIPIHGMWIVSVCILGIALIYACRHLILTYLGIMYPIEKETSRFSFSILIFNGALGILLLPINFFIAFSPDPVSWFFIVVGWALVALLFIYRQIRGLLLGLPLAISREFYFLLYLCAVEIAPFLLLWHFVGEMTT